MGAITIDDKALKRLERRMKRLAKKHPKKIAKMLKAVGSIVHGLAQEYSPMSMSKAQYTSTLKGGKTKRKTFTRGSLKQSITAEYFPTKVEIGVPSNSKAGDYAEKMHDEKGSSWQKLSKGKQPKSRDKYIYAAYEDSEKKIDAALDRLLDDFIDGL